MTDVDRSAEADDDHARWVSMWQEGVRACRRWAMGVAELSSARFLEVSSRAADLLGTTAQGAIGLSYLDIVDPPRAADESFRLARQGIIDGTRTRRRLRRPDGSTVDVHATGWAIRSPAGPDLGLWTAFEATSAEHRSVPEDIIAPAFPRQPLAALIGDRVTIDERWRVTEVQTDFESLLGRPPDDLLTRSLLDLTHPDDLPSLLFAIARATTDPNARALVRLRHRDGTWRVTHAAPTVPTGDSTLPLAFVLTAAEPADSAGSRSWVSEAPAHLRRIADQIETSGVLARLGTTADALGITATDLSPRQWEVLARVIRGERVSTISEEMYLSPSTVRNHLSSIFAKVGVHSQVELLALYRNVRSDDPS